MLGEGDVVAQRYRVIRELARGGMGVVYVVEHLETEQELALKVVLRQSVDAEEERRFRMEAKLAGKIESEHVVRVLDAGVDPASKMYFLVMELLKGEDLETMVTREGPLSPGTVAELMLQLASVLEAAHNYRDASGEVKPIVHRDLKPENLFVVKRSGRPLLKVLDFGLAKMLSTTSVSVSGFRGTPLYMSREQLANERITALSDIWAYALVAFRLLTAKHYWKAARGEAPSFGALCAEVFSSESLETPSARAQALGAPTPPSGFDEWFSRCVTTPEKRYASAREAGVALHEVLAPGVSFQFEEPATAPAEIVGRNSVSPATRSASFPRRNQSLVWGIALLVIIGVGVLASTWSRGNIHDAPAASATDVGSVIATPIAPSSSPNVQSPAPSASIVVVQPTAKPTAQPRLIVSAQASSSSTMPSAKPSATPSASVAPTGSGPIWNAR